MKVDSFGKRMSKVATLIFLLVSAFLYGDVVNPFLLSTTLGERMGIVFFTLCITMIFGGFAYLTEEES